MRFPLRHGEIVAAAPKAWSVEYDIAVEAPEPFKLDGERALIEVCGPLAQHGLGLYSCNYDALREACAAACASEATSIVLRIGSPGGDFAGCIELARDLRAMCSAAGKKLIAFSDSQIASAAYAIACAADEIVITPSAFVGSVGVWAALVDTVAADRAMGQNIVIVSSGTRKVDHNPHVAITEGAIDALQAQVFQMRDLFFGLVTEARAVSLDTLMSLAGSELLGQQAVAAGLADRIVGSWAEFTRNPPSQAATTGSNMSMKEAMAALAKAAEGDDDDAKKAKKCLAAMSDEDEGEGKGKKASAAADDKEADKDEKKAAAKAEDEKEELKKDEKKAAASAANHLSLAQELHALKAQLSADKEATERAQLLASRPDFDKTVRASLDEAPLAFVRKACKDWPRVTNGASPAAATVPGGTQGSSAVSRTSAEDTAYIADKMSGEYRGTGVRSRNNGFALELGYMSPEQVAEASAKLSSKGRA